MRVSKSIGETTESVLLMKFIFQGEPAQPKHPAPADTGETVYADPNRQRLEDSYDYPERTDTERPMSNVPLVERRHEITNVTTK